MRKYRIIILTAFIFELGLLTFFKGIAGPYVSAILLLAFSLIIGIYPLYINKDVAASHKMSRKPIPFPYRLLIVFSVVTLLTIVSVLILDNLFKSNPINPNNSIVIPTIQIMVQRFLNFEYPYKIITNLGVFIPSFMPFQWIPFLFAELLKIDYRWIAFIFWLIGTLFYSYRLLKKNTSTLILILLSVLPFATLFVFIKYVPESFINNIELLIAGFYMILSLSLLSNSMVFRVFGIVVTLLSRFYNVLWIPLNIAITYFAEKEKRAKILTASIILAVVIFYALPFLTQNLNIFQQGQKYKTQAAIEEWDIKEAGLSDKPSLLFQGVGVACFFYEFKPGSIVRKLKAIQKLHLIISILSILILAIIFLTNLKIIEHNMFNLLSLKIHLAIFFNFIQVPHVYLFLVPIFVSVIILAEIFSLEKKTV